MKNNKRNTMNFLGLTENYKGVPVGSTAYYAIKAEEEAKRKEECHDIRTFVRENYSHKVIKTVEESEDDAIDDLLKSGFNNEYYDYLFGGKR